MKIVFSHSKKQLTVDEPASEYLAWCMVRKNSPMTPARFLWGLGKLDSH